MAFWVMRLSGFAVADELRRLIHWIETIFRQRARTKQRARFWSEVHAGQKEAEANTGGYVGLRLEGRLRHQSRSRKV